MSGAAHAGRNDPKGENGLEKQPQTTLSGYPVTEDMLSVQKQLDELFDMVYREETEKITEMDS